MIFLFFFVSNSQPCTLSINIDPGQLKNTVVIAGLDESEAFFKAGASLLTLATFVLLSPLVPPRALSVILVMLSLPSPPSCLFFLYPLQIHFYKCHLPLLVTPLVHK